MSYLSRDKGGRYFYRRVIPAELRPFMPEPFTGKANWKRALGTSSPAIAKKLFAKVHADCEAHLAHALKRSGGEIDGVRPPPALAAASVSLGGLGLTYREIEDETYRRVLENDMEFRQEGDFRAYQAPEERGGRLIPIKPGAMGMPEDLALAYGEELAMLKEDYARAYQRQDISIIRGELMALLREKGAAIVPESNEFKQASLAMLRGNLRAYQDLLRRHEGNIVETPAPPLSKGPKLSEALALWENEAAGKGERRARSNTIREARYAVRRFVEARGDLPLGAINKADVRAFRDMLKALPMRLNNKDRIKPLPELARQQGEETISAATVNKYLTLLSAIFGHTKREGHLDHLHDAESPFASMRLSAGKGRRSEGRQPFSATDLAAIFGADVFTAGVRPIGGGEEASFWFPLIGLLTGARLGEIAQLRVTDLAQDPEFGTWYFDISTEGGRQIKNDDSIRTVPVHAKLIALGLLDYRQWRWDSGASLSDPLFPGVDSVVANQVAAAWSKWFGRWLRVKAGIEDKRKVFHSFRHTFKDLSRDAEIPEETHDAFTGHRGVAVSRRYGLGAGLVARSKAMNTISPPTSIASIPVWKPPAPGSVRRKVPKRKLVPRIPKTNTRRSKERS